MRKGIFRNLWLAYDTNFKVDVTTVLKNLYDGVVTAAITGNVTGNVTGDVTGDVTKVATNIAADTALGDADFATTFIELDGTASCDVTGFTPTKGNLYVITCTESTNDPTVTTSAGVTFDGTNNTATFPDAADTLIVFAISATAMVVVENIGTVGLTSV